MIEALANVGDFLGGVGVVVSLIYLAVQIRQNTTALQSASYHQTAEQMWAWTLSVSTDPTLAKLLTRSRSGEELNDEELLRINTSAATLLFGFENCLRLREQGLIDDDVWENLMANSALALDSFRGLLESRPGVLSGRLLAQLDMYLAKAPG